MDNETRPSELSVKAKKIIVIVSIAIMLAVWAVIFYFVGRPLIRFINSPQQFRAWVDERGLLAAVAFVGMVILQVVVAIIPGEPFEIAAGYAFGFWKGTLLVLIGIVIGSAAVVTLTRCFGPKMLECFFAQEKIEQLSFLKNEKRRNWLMFTIFMIPGTPKDLLTYFIGLMPMDIKSWLLIAGIARIPSVVTSTIGGSALGSAEYGTAAAVFLITAIISVAGMAGYNRYIARRTAGTQAEQAEAEQLSDREQ